LGFGLLRKDLDLHRAVLVGLHDILDCSDGLARQTPARGKSKGQRQLLEMRLRPSRHARALPRVRRGAGEGKGGSIVKRQLFNAIAVVSAVLFFAVAVDTLVQVWRIHHITYSWIDSKGDQRSHCFEFACGSGFFMVNFGDTTWGRVQPDRSEREGWLFETLPAERWSSPGAYFHPGYWIQKLKFGPLSSGYVKNICNISVPFWIAAILCAVAPATWLRRRLRAQVRDDTPRCPGCGYDLRATPERCPECGAHAPPRTLNGIPAGEAAERRQKSE
jgi:hypothetical protein